MTINSAALSHKRFLICSRGTTQGFRRRALMLFFCRGDAARVSRLCAARARDVAAMQRAMQRAVQRATCMWDRFFEEGHMQMQGPACRQAPHPGKFFP